MDRRLWLDKNGTQDNCCKSDTAVTPLYESPKSTGREKYVKHEEYFPPQEVFTNALKVSDLRRLRVPEYIPLTKFMLLSLMESMKFHPTNEHVCLMWAKPQSHPDFNAYNLQIVRPKDLNNNSYFILSKHGFLFFTNGFTEYISMDEFEREINLYEQINEIKFFKQFRLWKGFIMWRIGVGKKGPSVDPSTTTTTLVPKTGHLIDPTCISMKILQHQILSTKNTLSVSLDICELVEKHFRKCCKGENEKTAQLLSQLNKNNFLYTENQKKLLMQLLNACHHQEYS